MDISLQNVSFTTESDLQYFRLSGLLHCFSTNLDRLPKVFQNGELYRCSIGGPGWSLIQYTNIQHKDFVIRKYRLNHLYSLVLGLLNTQITAL